MAVRLNSILSSFLIRHKVLPTHWQKSLYIIMLLNPLTSSTTTLSPRDAVRALNPSITTPSPTDVVTETLASGLQRRRPGTRILQIFNGLPDPQEETLDSSHQPTPLPNPVASIPSERLSIKITINRVCRIFSILGLGFGGGWSCIPDEARAPTSTIWVIFIVILVDWLICSHRSAFLHPAEVVVFFCRISVTSVLDCLYPKAMDWYFRYTFKHRLLYASVDRDNSPFCPVRITLYRLFNIFLALGYLLVRVIKSQDQGFLSKVEFIFGGFGVL
jgi:hypothetical protein